MAGSGPAGSLSPKRSNPRVGVQVLPAGGRTGTPPPWPLSRQSEAESEAWVSLWASPQAVAWERLGWTRVVARYCVIMVRAEGYENAEGELVVDDKAWAEARQLEDRLGLTPKAMRMLLWVVSEDEVGERRTQPPAPRRRRLAAVDAGA